MTRLNKIAIAVLASLTSMQGICASTSYRLADSEDNQVCNAVLESLKQDQITAKTDHDICELMNGPTSQIFHGKEFASIKWSGEQASTQAEREAVARQIHESRIDPAQAKLFAKNEAGYFADIQSAISSSDVVIERAELKFGAKSVYAVQMRRNQCRANYKGYDGVPNWGFFSDKATTQGLPSSPDTPPGSLFYFNGRLLTFVIIPDSWEPTSNVSTKKTELAANVWSMDSHISTNGGVTFTTQLVCNFSIHK